MSTRAEIESATRIPLAEQELRHEIKRLREMLEVRDKRDGLDTVRVELGTANGQVYILVTCPKQEREEPLARYIASYLLTLMGASQLVPQKSSSGGKDEP